MDSVNTSIWTNDSRFLLNVLNYSSNLTKNNAAQRDDSKSIFILILCGLGLPGNLFVIAVYMFKMTTSTRVYMFALAVADSVVCISGMAFKFATHDFVTKKVFEKSISISATFSMLLLVFVSIERLIAVRRPHAFSKDTQRAKKAVIIILVPATLLTVMIEMAKVTSFTPFVDVFKICVLFSGALIMITCYTLMAIELLKKVFASRNQVGVQRVKRSISTIADPGYSCNPGPSNLPTIAEANMQSGAKKSASVTATNNKTAKYTKTIKSVFLLFIITITFITCWLPLWLYNMGVASARQWIGLIILNSVVNPFIYTVVSAMFREDVRQFYRQTRVKLSACCH